MTFAKQAWEIAESGCELVEAPQPFAYGKKWFGEETYYRWAVWRIEDVNPKQVACAMLTHFQRSYSGPGFHFSGCPYVRSSNSLVLVSQRCGWDV